MPREQLPPDSDSVAKWEKLPRNQPSKWALPPVAGGGRWTLWLVLILAAVIVLALLLQGRIT
jgi:hypothetical protein